MLSLLDTYVHVHHEKDIIQSVIQAIQKKSSEFSKQELNDDLPSFLSIAVCEKFVAFEPSYMV